MSGTVVIHQPDFLPYLGFFHRFLYADLWVILDDVQFVRGTSRSWQNRDLIKTPAGKRWISVGVEKCHLSTKINEVILAKNGWERKNIDLIEQNYRKAPFFDEIFPHLEKLYAHEYEKMVDFNIASVRMLMDLFNIEIETIASSSLAVTGHKTERLVDILRKVGASTYLSGTGARSYLQAHLLDKASIELVWQEFKHPVYPQLHGDFIPYLSSIDLLLNCGIEKSREMIRNCL